MRRLIVGTIAVSLFMIALDFGERKHDSGVTPSETDVVGVTARVLSHLAGQRDISIDKGRLICHLTSIGPAWEAEGDGEKGLMEAWAMMWLGLDWSPEELSNTEGMARLFERGFWREGEDPAHALQSLANRVELDGRCRQLAGLDVQNQGRANIF